MYNIFKTNENKLEKISDFENNIWVRVLKPTHDEIKTIAENFDIYYEDISAVLDMDESSRFCVEEKYRFVIINIPISKGRNSEKSLEEFFTIPLAIFFTNKGIVTVCEEKSSILSEFQNGRVKDFDTSKPFEFVYKILLNSALEFQNYLKKIETYRMSIELNIENKTEETDLFNLNKLETSLVYFMISLRSDKIAVEKMERYKIENKDITGQDMIVEIIIEFQQAIEMASAYSDVIGGTRELLSIVIDHRLNNVMKYLTSITLVMAIPTIISGFYGMNVDSEWMPLSQTPHGFSIVFILTVILSSFAVFYLRKKDMF